MIVAPERARIPTRQDSANGFWNSLSLLGGASVVVAPGAEFQTPVLDVAGFRTLFVAATIQNTDGQPQVVYRIIDQTTLADVAGFLAFSPLPATPNLVATTYLMAVDEIAANIGAQPSPKWFIKLGLLNTGGLANTTFTNVRLWASSHDAL